MAFDYLAPWRFRCGWRRLKRFIAWFPILWDDEDWDAAYLYEIMRFKISRMRADVERNQRHTTWERKVKDMRIAEFVLNRLAFSDHYHDNFAKFSESDLCTCKHIEEKMELIDSPCGTYASTKFHYCRYCQLMLKHRYGKQETQEIRFVMDLIAKKSQRWWN